MKRHACPSCHKLLGDGDDPVCQMYNSDQEAFIEGLELTAPEPELPEPEWPEQYPEPPDLRETYRVGDA